MATAPNTDNYMLGRGRIYFDRFDANGNKTGEVDLGNAPAFSINVESEKLDHYSSRSGLRVKDKTVVLGMNVSCSFTLDEINLNNLALALAGDLDKYSQGASTGATHQITNADLEVWYDLGYRNVTVTAVEVSSTSKTGYDVDAIRGLIKFKTGGDINTGDTVDVTFDYAIDESEIIKAVTNEKLTGQLRFIGDPAAGIAYEAIIWKGDLSASGEIGFITESDWANMQFTFDVGKDETNHPNSPYFDIIKLS